MPIKKLLLPLPVACLLLAFESAAQNNPAYSTSLIPDSLAKQANAVIRSFERALTIKNEHEAILKEHRVITVFNDRSHYDLLVLPYNSYEKIKKIKGNIYDATGNLLREVEKGEIKDISAIADFSIYEDDRIKYVDVDHVNYPFTIEYEYEKSFNELMGYPAWEVHDFATGVESAEFTLSIPADLGISYAALNFDGKPMEETNRGYKTLTWKVANLAPVSSEPYGPLRSELLPMLLLAPHRFEVANNKGSMADWTAFGQFMNHLAEKKDELSPTMKAKVAELVAGAPDEKTKVDRLYKYMQSNMRYVSVQLGIGGWQPFDAKYVEQNKYGDCKALTNFMKAVLKEAGIVAYAVLVQGGDLRFEAKPDFATSAAFNHMILHVPSLNYWLECTRNDFPPNYLGSFTADRNALLLTETGGKIVRTPVYPPASNLDESTVKIELLPSGEANLEVSSQLYAESHEHLRDAKSALSAEELKKEIQAESDLPSLTVQDLALNIDPEKPVASLRFKLKVPRYANKASKRLFVPINAIHPFKLVPSQAPLRKQAIHVKKGYAEHYVFQLSIPNGYEIENAPLEGIHLSSEMGSFDLSCVVENGQITVKRELVILPIKLPADQYNDWRNFYKEIAKADGVKLVFVEKKS